MKRLVVGLLAHVDSGKTTLSEALMFRAGALRKMGRVDHADTFLDTDEIERRRGITVFSKQAVLRMNDTELTLLDTPGHADLAAEMERTLDVLDYALLIISAADGIKSHTETLWNLLKKHRTPTFIFINKMDREDANAEELMRLLKEKLSDSCVDFSSSRLDDELAMCDETLMEDYLSFGNLPGDDLNTAIARRRIFPCFFGSALKLTGIDGLLSALDRYTREPPRLQSFGAQVFKIAEDAQGARLTFLALTGGSMKVKSLLSGVSRDGTEWSEKVDQIRIYSGDKYSSAEEVYPGMVCAVTGLSRTLPGDGLGVQSAGGSPTLEPVMACSVIIPENADPHEVMEMLRRLAAEEPMLRPEWDGGEIRVHLMGQVQLEVMKAVIARRFGVDVDFGPGRVMYKETIARSVEGVGHYEPLKHYAEVHLKMEPGEPGSGLVFDSSCRTDDLDINWQRLIMTHLAEKTHIGTAVGAPVTDMKITLVSGRAHIKHTEGGDFRQATYRAVRQGLRLAGTVLLEPWYDFTLEVPLNSVGHAMNDIQRMCGRFEAPETYGETAVIRGSVPAATCGEYRRDVLAYTSGRGTFSCVFKGYEPCHNADEVIASANYDCDADTENTADSVFCAHGAGFVVKWDAVYAHMHIPAEKDRQKPVQEPVELLADRAAAFCDSLAKDKELLSIFERTYGPVKYDLRRALSPAQKPDTSRSKKETDLQEYLLVDGYNIIFAWDDLRALASESMEAARSSLINLLCNYQGVRRCELILVFDAYRVSGGKGSVERVHNINVVYTREAETADMYIEKIAHGLGTKRRVRVATSDGLEQLIVLGQGARRVSADAFRSEVYETMKAIRDYLAKM